MVWVIDGRPRYHLASCLIIKEQQTLAIPRSQALEDGFLPVRPLRTEHRPGLTSACCTSDRATTATRLPRPGLLRRPDRRPCAGQTCARRAYRLTAGLPRESR